MDGKLTNNPRSPPALTRNLRPKERFLVRNHEDKQLCWNEVETSLIYSEIANTDINKTKTVQLNTMSILADEPARVGYWCSFFFFLPLFFPSLDVMVLKDICRMLMGTKSLKYLNHK